MFFYFFRGRRGFSCLFGVWAGDFGEREVLEVRLLFLFSFLISLVLFCLGNLAR